MSSDIEQLQAEVKELKRKIRDRQWLEGDYSRLFNENAVMNRQLGKSIL